MGEVFRFEVGYRLRQPSTWVYALVLLGIPFLLTSMALSRFFSFTSKIRKHYHTIELVSGGLLVAIGVLIFTGQLTIIVRYLQPYLPVY